ncbi:MAG TPA: alpha/beta fold hydrolase [Polyangiaceae bacterium]|nr:alpha/beta fold hydrolase [Polyangiaceae bacterium]
MRAREPDQQGFVERGSVRVGYEVFGEGPRTIVFLPPWSIVHSRIWKAQVPYFARHMRVITIDGRGNGRSDRPASPGSYDDREFAADALAVLDAVGVERAAIVSFSAGAYWHLILAAEHPERVEGSIFMAPAVPLAPRHAARHFDFNAQHSDHEGWKKYNRHYWLAHYRDFLQFFFEQVFSEAHSTKQIEDCVGWGLESTPEMLIATAEAPGLSAEQVRELCTRVKGPVLVLHGDEDKIVPLRRGAALAEAIGGKLVTLEGAGHGPMARDPVKTNLLLRDFVMPRPPAERWTRAVRRPKRALFISSPIGLGHAQRDVAIADELRKLHPGLQIDWLAQSPVTRVLEARGERIHPQSAQLASESAHIESEASEHDLHCFQAWRRMDEIMVANFMAFHDLVQDEKYDVWVGDEAWEVDYFLHENPEEKRAPYVWLTDFVGWLPMPDGGAHEQALTADYNAEMIAQIERFPRVRDRAIFVGEPDDIVPDRFGRGLPEIRAWTEEHFDFAGYVTGFDPADFSDRAALRTELGYREDERICIVTVGGSGVGRSLLERVMAAFPAAKRQIPALRMVVVAGPRIEPSSLGVKPTAGLEVRPYVDRLYRHLAACDLAVVQGGLTTTMELAANRRPFIYFPLRHHFEQNFHVRHRLDRFRAGRCMDFDRSGPAEIAAAIAEEMARPASNAAVDGGGAARAAAKIAELL